MTTRTVTVGFAIFCGNCESLLRPALDSDQINQMEHCVNCDMETKVTLGVVLLTNYKDDLDWAYKEMMQHIRLMRITLLKKFGKVSENEWE